MKELVISSDDKQPFIEWSSHDGTRIKEIEVHENKSHTSENFYTHFTRPKVKIVISGES